jgi:hypothetical protein
LVIEKYCTPLGGKLRLGDSNKNKLPNLKVFSDSTGQRVGKISKQWSGLAKEMFTDADNFGISFPMDLDVRIKAVLLGAVFLIVSYDDNWHHSVSKNYSFDY